MSNDSSAPKAAKRVAFSGYSDDVVTYGDGEKHDEIRLACSERWKTVRFLVGEFGRGVIVALRYGAPASSPFYAWSVSVTPSADESAGRGVPSIPDGWTISFENGDRPYAMVLVITCPTDTRVRRLASAKREREQEDHLLRAHKETPTSDVPS